MERPLFSQPRQFSVEFKARVPVILLVAQQTVFRGKANEGLPHAT